MTQDTESSSKLPSKFFLWFLVLVFFLERTVLAGWFARINENASYFLEGGLIIAFLGIRWKKIHWRFHLDWRWAFFASLHLICGAVVFAIAERMKLMVPFSFGTPGFAVMLIVIGPFIEEFLYRGLLWDVSHELFHSAFATLFVTSVLFSLDHFQAYFGVDDIFRGFILYQTFYTLVFGLSWGYSRIKSKSIVSSVFLHMLFNLGFFIAAQVYPMAVQPPTAATATEVDGDSAAATQSSDLSEWSEFNEAIGALRQNTTDAAQPNQNPRNGPRILIADMPVSDVSLFKKNPGVQIYSGSDSAKSPLLGKGCGEDLKHIEEFFAAILASRAPPFQLDDVTVRQLENTLWQTHGYHVLGLVQKGLSKSEILMLPMNHPPSILDGISDYQKYINQIVLPEMVGLYRMVRDQQPDIVLAATSETFEENERDLKTGGLSAAEAQRGAEEIMGAYVGAWTTLINSFPKVRFIVPVGNGGADSLGDRLESKMVRKGPIPAVLPFANLIRVASYEKRKDSCLSSFSNFGVEGSDVAAKGREVESWAPCSERPTVRLTGTSQSAAKVASYLAASLENNVSIDDALKNFQKEPCLEDRVATAARLPEP